MAITFLNWEQSANTPGRKGFLQGSAAGSANSGKHPPLKALSRTCPFLQPPLLAVVSAASSLAPVLMCTQQQTGDFSCHLSSPGDWTAGAPPYCESGAPRMTWAAVNVCWFFLTPPVFPIFTAVTAAPSEFKLTDLCLRDGLCWPVLWEKPQSAPSEAETWTTVRPDHRPFSSYDSSVFLSGTAPAAPA